MDKVYSDILKKDKNALLILIDYTASGEGGKYPSVAMDQENKKLSGD